MNQEKVLKTLLAPIVSEKTTILSSYSQYVFKVRVDSNKREIKKAVETLFSVDVTNVNVSNVKGKSRVFKGRAGKRSNWKKAIIKLASGQIIDISKK